MLEFEKLINDYLKNNINENTDISVLKIKNDIKRLINQEPGVEVKYNKERGINEVKGKKVKTVKETVKSVTIAYIIDDVVTDKTPQVKKIEFYI